MKLTEEDINNVGAPKALFIEDFAAALGDTDAKEGLKSIDDLFKKYQYLEASLMAQRKGLKEKLPEIVLCLEAVENIAKKNAAAEEMRVQYPLADHIYSEALLDKCEYVAIWLGANVMMDFPIADALELLKNKIQACTSKIESLRESIDFLRQQITTCEVNQRRLINYSIKVNPQPAK
eukprot:Platyproteum_vivax@DN5854_c0_g1_i1.p1